MRPRGSNPATTQSVSRALSILTSFDRSRPTRRVSEIASELDVSPSSASRLLYGLEEFGLLERDQRTREYRLGLALVSLASQALNMNPIYRAALPAVAATAAEIDQTVNLAILRDDSLFYLAVVESPDNLTPFSMTGETGPLHSTALGTILLSGLPATERERVIARIEYPCFTANTTSTPDRLRAKVEEAVRRGFAVDREESSLGRGCVAAAIRDATGSVVAAISVTGPMSVLALDGQAPPLGARMIEIGDQISRRLGYRGVAAAVERA
jgi:DNA-binding IclR family transcriptional regulator